MTDQLLLFTPQERFSRWLQFHRANPQVYELFLRFTREAKERGRERFGARVIWERLRWYLQIETTGDDYKLNDHYPPYYARLVMLRHRDLEGFFERRDKRFDVDDETLLREADKLEGVTA